jgi:hypothetical protein
MYLIKKKVMQMLICLSSNKALLVVPATNDLKALHPLLIDNFHLYCCDQGEVRTIIANGDQVRCYAEHFRGCIQIRTDNTSYQYAADEEQCLPVDDVIEVIKAICHYRDSPALWIN